MIALGLSYIPDKRITSIYNFLLVSYLSVGEFNNLIEVSLVVVEVFAYSFIKNLTIIVANLYNSLKDSSIFL